MYFEVEKYELEMLEDNRFSRMKLYLAHSGLNKNNSTIGHNVLEEAANSILGVPILANIIEEDDDFGEHDMEYDEAEDKITYIEKPIGHIPELSHNYHYEEVDGKTYAVVFGYIYNLYAQDAVEIIKRDEDIKLSIEIVIDKSKYNRKTKILDIVKFRYTGVTLLGKKYATGMVGAHALLENFSNQSKDKYLQQVEELNKYLMKFSEIEHEKPSIESKKINEEEDVLVSKTKEDIAAYFKLTANQLYSELSRVIGESKYITTNWYGESVERECYYLSDYDESFVYFVDVKENYLNKKVPYTLDGDNVKINFEEATRIKYSPVDWEEGSDSEEIEIESYTSKVTNEAKEAFSKVLAEKELLNEQLVSKSEALLTMSEQNSNLEQQVEILLRFKEEIENQDRVEKVEIVFEKYAKHLTSDEIDSFRKEQSKFERFEEFEKEVKLFVADKVADKLTKQPSKFIRMGIPLQNETSESTDLWGSPSNNKI